MIDSKYYTIYNFGNYISNDVILNFIYKKN